MEHLITFPYCFLVIAVGFLFQFRRGSPRWVWWPVLEVEDIHLPETNSLHLKIDSLEREIPNLESPCILRGDFC